MQEILDLKGGPHGHISPVSHGSKLVSADYHGAEVEVVRSRCPGRVGVKGIVVRDTKFTFVVVTEKDEMKSKFGLRGGVRIAGDDANSGPIAAIPKEHTIFRFTVPVPMQPEGAQDQQKQADANELKPLVFELHGSQFENRPVDRANKKFKWRNVDYI